MAGVGKVLKMLKLNDNIQESWEKTVFSYENA